METGLIGQNESIRILNETLKDPPHLFFTGGYGCGKTTFFKLASGQLEATNGYILADERLRVGYYNQQIIDHLPLDLNPIEYLQSAVSENS